MMENLEIYSKVKSVPDNAQKKIVGGRLKGMTDINPMWRIQVLTEQFGPCGIGWYYDIVSQWIQDGAGDEKVAFTNINLYVKVGDNWSMPIIGTGGSSFISKESKGLYTNDECYKMSLTDAISVACKALGIGADVYWEHGKTKYVRKPKDEGDKKIDVLKINSIFKASGEDKELIHQVISRYGYKSGNEIMVKDYPYIIKEVEKLAKGNK